MNCRYLLVVLLTAASLGGCAHLAPPDADTLAKLMQPVPSKGVIFVIATSPRARRGA